MEKTKLRYLLTVSGVVLALVAGGCGGSSSDGHGTGSSSSSEGNGTSSGSSSSWGGAEVPFVMTVNSGPDRTFTVPTNEGHAYVYDYSVDCDNDGVDEFTGQTGDVTCTYDLADHNYTVAIRGKFPAIRFGKDHEIGVAGYRTDHDKLMAIDRWGDQRWETMFYAFAYCGNMIYRATDRPDLSGVESLAYMFDHASKFNGAIGDWDVSHVKSLAGMFTYALIFDQDLSDWNVSGVTDMSAMFYATDRFNRDLSRWDVRRVENMYAMFYAAAYSRDLNDWNVSNVKNMSYMFAWGYFDGNISGWDVGSVKNMRMMFGRTKAFNGDISDWNVSSVTDMSDMFAYAARFNADVEKWGERTANVTTMKEMFRGAEAFTGHDLRSWDVSKVTDHTDFGTGWGSGNIEPLWP